MEDNLKTPQQAAQEKANKKTPQDAQLKAEKKNSCDKPIAAGAVIMVNFKSHLTVCQIETILDNS